MLSCNEAEKYICYNLSNPVVVKKQTVILLYNSLPWSLGTGHSKCLTRGLGFFGFFFSSVNLTKLRSFRGLWLVRVIVAHLWQVFFTSLRAYCLFPEVGYSRVHNHNAMERLESREQMWETFQSIVSFSKLDTRLTLITNLGNQNGRPIRTLRLWNPRFP